MIMNLSYGNRKEMIRENHKFRPEISEENWLLVQILINKPIRNFNNALTELLVNYQKLKRHYPRP